MSTEFKKYPICDADMWVYMCLSGFCDRVFLKYDKLIFADVVEQEILSWERHEDKYKKIAVDFIDNKSRGKILVIHHSTHIDALSREILEHALVELDFQHGLLNNPKEKNKGEFVSALYADFFGIPFMKTNDSAFKEGGQGKKAFPELLIKDWYDLVEELAENQEEKMRVRRLVHDEQDIMRRRFDLKKTEERKEQQLLLLRQKINSGRL